MNLNDLSAINLWCNSMGIYRFKSCSISAAPAAQPVGGTWGYRREARKRLPKASPLAWVGDKPEGEEMARCIYNYAAE